MSSDTTTRPKRKPLKPPYVIVVDADTDTCLKSGMCNIVMHEALVEEQSDGSIVVKGTPGYHYSLESAVNWVKLLRGDIKPE